MKMKKLTQTLNAIILALATAAIFAITAATAAIADDNESESTQIGISGFLDEDGDGFNDLMPDSDGDGVPDALDPDNRNRQSDNNFIHEQLRAADDTSGVRHRELPGDDYRHPIFHDGMGPIIPGEPGQFGPGDSTGHGGMGGDRRHGGHHGDDGGDPDTSGMGGGGHRPIIGPRDGENVRQQREEVIRENSTIESRPNSNGQSQSSELRESGK
jgi:hypothetical protein